MVAYRYIYIYISNTNVIIIKIHLTYCSDCVCELFVEEFKTC